MKSMLKVHPTSILGHSGCVGNTYSEYLFFKPLFNQHLLPKPKQAAQNWVSSLVSILAGRFIKNTQAPISKDKIREEEGEKKEKK